MKDHVCTKNNFIMMLHLNYGDKMCKNLGSPTNKLEANNVRSVYLFTS